MPRYLLNILESNGHLTQDDVGQDLPSLEAAQVAALISARELLAENLKFVSVTLDSRHHHEPRR
jgi:hypothetical protein